MLDDDVDSRELNIAELADTEKKVELEDEAIAEEEFVAIEEDEINPMLFDEQAAEEEPVEPAEEEKLLDGAIGSGDLEIPEEPFNNEEALRNENVNEDEKMTPTTETDGALVDPFASVEETGDVAAVSEAAPTSEIKATESAAPAVEPSVAPEPVAEAPAPAAEPAADPISAAVPEDPAAATAAAEQPKKKKGKAGLIIGIIIALLLIGGGIGFFVWYSIHETPENSVKDAISKLWEAENIKLKGDIKTSVDIGGGDKTESTVSLDVSASGNDASANIDIKAKAKEYELNLGLEVIEANKVGYIKVKDAKSATDLVYQLITGLMTAFGGEQDDEDDMQMKTIKAVFDSLGEALSDAWIKLDSETSTSMKCLTEKGEALSTAEFKKKIAKVYGEHTFIVVDENAEVVEKDGIKYIAVKINKDEFNAFVKAVNDLQEVKDLNSCSESEDPMFDIDNKTDEDLKNMSVKLGVKPFSHELAAIVISEKNEEEKSESSANLKLSYEKATISAPSDVKTIDDIDKKFQETAKAKSKEVAKEYVEKQCKSMFTAEAQIKSCVDTALPQVESGIEEQFDGVSLKDLFKQATSMTGGLTSAIR